MQICDFGLDLWIELILSNELSNQDIFNLSLTCKFLSRLLKNDKIIQHTKFNKKIHFGIYQVENGELENLAVSWSHDSRLLATGDGDGHIYIWNVTTGETKTPEKHIAQSDYIFIWSLAFHPQRTDLLATGYNNGAIYLWDLEKSERITKYEGNTNGIVSIAFHPQGKFLASGCFRGTVRLWNVETGDSEKVLIDTPFPHPASVAFTNDGKFLGASSSVLRILVWNFETFQLVREIIASDPTDFIPPYSRISFGFFNDNKTLVFASQTEGCLKFYDFVTGHEKVEMRLKMSIDPRFELIIHPKNQNIIASRQPRNLEIWDTRTKSIVERLPRITDLSFSPNGRALAVAFWGLDLGVFDMKKIFQKSQGEQK